MPVEDAQKFFRKADESYSGRLTGRLESSLSAECGQFYLPGHGYHSTEALSQ
jgi:hypothetical protein